VYVTGEFRALEPRRYIRHPQEDEMDRPIVRVQTDGVGEKLSHPTGGEVFSHASLLEIVRDPSEATRPALLHWNEKVATVAPEMMVGERRCVPVEIDPSLCRHLHLPSRFVDYGVHHAAIRQCSWSDREIFELD
jgi:hypothetical protein